ncbi:MAG: MarR family winged helix-turn-helix transcriptional regulator [Nocardioides sp.]
MGSELEDLGSDLVVQAARLVRAVRRRIDQPVGTRVLALLDQFGALGITALADADRTSQPTMSGTVSQLEQLGWVAKQTDPADARKTLVSLTDAGRERLAGARRDNGEAVARRLERTTHTRAEIATAVAVLRDVLEQPGHDGL